MKQIFAILVLGLLAHTISAQSVLGTWKTIDDETGKAKAIVLIYEEDGKLYGKITELIRTKDQDPDPICENCKGRKKGQKIKGMVIMNDLAKNGNEYDGGSILDPDNGKIYDCKIWLKDDNTLMVRGYIGLFFRTQEWIKVE